MWPMLVFARGVLCSPRQVFEPRLGDCESWLLRLRGLHIVVSAVCSECVCLAWLCPCASVVFKCQFRGGQQGDLW
jgi:hypothetical protein